MTISHIRTLENKRINWIRKVYIKIAKSLHCKINVYLESLISLYKINLQKCSSSFIGELTLGIIVLLKSYVCNQLSDTSSRTAPYIFLVFLYILYLNHVSTHLSLANKQITTYITLT